MSQVGKWVLPGLVVLTSCVLFFITRVENWGLWCIILILLALFGTKRDAKPIGWAAFLPAGLITLERWLGKQETVRRGS